MRWIEGNLIHSQGDFFGRPFRLLPEQKRFLHRWYAFDRASGRWRYNRALRGEARGGGKTELLAAIACLEFAGPAQIARPSPDIPIAAASFEQADLLFGAAALMLGGKNGIARDVAPLAQFFECFDTEILFADRRPGRMYRIAAEAGTNEGSRPSLFVADEVHAWEGRKARVHTVISAGLSKRQPRGRELNCSTAGVGVGSVPPRDEDSLLWKLYATGLMQQGDPAVAPDFLFDWHGADPLADLEDPVQRLGAVRDASPAADLLWDAEDRSATWGSPEMPAHEFKRYFLNLWVEAGAEGWLADRPGAWQACEGDTEIPDGARVDVGIDMALYRDSAAVSWVWFDAARDRFVVRCRVWSPDDGRIDHLDVMAFIRSLAVRYRLGEVDYDSRFFEVPAQTLADEGFPMIDVPQSAARMVPACGNAYELVVAGRVEHDGDPILSAHVLAAARRDGEAGWTLSKGRSRAKIDACIAMVLALWAAVHQGHQGPATAAQPEPVAAGGGFRSGRLRI